MSNNTFGNIDMLVILPDNEALRIHYGEYNLGYAVYTVNSLGIYRTNNFGTQKLLGDNVKLNEVTAIELRGLYRSIMK